MRQYLKFILPFIIMCFLSCTDVEDNSDWSEDKIIEISPEIVPVKIFGTPNETDGMTIRITGTNHSENVPTTFIEGFEFEPGYFYTLKVRIIHFTTVH